jgi:hypothetical protein
MTRTETVTSPLLNEPPAEVEKPARVIDPDYEATPDEWMARIGGRS